jgi:large subunit ribosomal protein L5
MNDLMEKYNNEKIKLGEELGIKNPHAIPFMKKILVNMGIKEALDDKKVLEKNAEILGKITGQKPKVTKARMSVATFKLRKGQEIGLVVTLRGKRMYAFFDKLTKIVLPRLRDFRGVSVKNFDGHGNYNLGFPENTVFPEIDPGSIDRPQGLQVTIVTSAKDNREGEALLRILGMPFIK